MVLGGAVVALVLGLAAAGCGDDDDDTGGGDGTSTDDRAAVCDARDDLDDEIQDLDQVDLTETSIADVREILDDIGDDLSAIEDARSTQLTPFVDDLRSSLSGLTDTLADLGSGSSLSEAADSVTSSLDEVKTSAQELATAAETECD